MRVTARESWAATATAGLTRVDVAVTRLVDAEEALLGGLSSTEQARLGALLRKLHKMRNSFNTTDL